MKTSILIILLFISPIAFEAKAQKYENTRYSERELNILSKVVESLEKNKDNNFRRHLSKISNRELAEFANLVRCSLLKGGYDIENVRYCSRLLEKEIDVAIRKELEDDQLNLLQNKQKPNKKITIEDWKRFAVNKVSRSSEADMDFLRKNHLKPSKKDYIDKAEFLLKNRACHDVFALINHLPSAYGKLIHARAVLCLNRSDANFFLKKVPDHFINDPGLLYERVAYRKRMKFHTAAEELLASVRNQGDYVAEFWELKKYYIREIIYDQAKDRMQRAYDMASSHSMFPGSVEFAEGEWLAGWISLRFLNKPETALKHFSTMRENVKRSISVSRASYWQARALEAMGHLDSSKAIHEKNARIAHTFYGQMSAMRIKHTMDLKFPIIQTDVSDRERFENSLHGRCAIIGMLVDLTKIASSCMRLKVGETSHPSTTAFAARVAIKMGRPDIALIAAKEAEFKGFFIPDVLFPLEYANFRAITGKNAALHLALIRQESGFEVGAISSAGAMGLMQMMPAVAKVSARKCGMRFDEKMLLKDPDYNVNLGICHLNEVLQKNNSSRIVSASAYNAGEKNANRWIRDLGDPRTMSEDAKIDWIESIPYAETRNYVQRIIENENVYKVILGQDKSSVKVAMK